MRKGKGRMQSWTYYFGVLQHYRKVSIHQMDSGTWYLVYNYYIRVASRVAEHIKTYNLRELGNVGRTSKLGGDIAHYSDSFPEKELS